MTQTEYVESTSPANTARTTATRVVPTQPIDSTGKVSPAGELATNAPFVKLSDGTNLIKTIGGLGQSDSRGIYVIGLDKGTYTPDGTWTIATTGFTGLTLENFPHKILNITTGEAYDTTNATITDTTIGLDSTKNTGLTAPTATDKLFIPLVQDVRAYDDSLDLIKVGEQSPFDQQVLEETLLSAVTATGASSNVNVLDKKELTVCVVASSVTNGGTFTFQSTPDQTNYGTVASIDIADTVSSTQVITANGTYFYEIVNASSIKWFRANLTARTDGTYTVYLFARA